MINPRINSARIIQTILEEKVFFNTLKSLIPDSSKAYTNALILSSLRNWVPLKKILAKYVNKKIPHKHRIAEYLLLLAINELLCMHTAPYAVINETVKNIRSQTDRFLSGMANAVLRKVLANSVNEKSFLIKANKLPEDFFQILKDSSYSSEEICAVSDMLSVLPPTDLSLKGNPIEWQKKLNAKLMPNGSLRLQTTDIIEKLDGYKQGSWWVQDLAASFAVQTLGDLHNKNVVDLCAAPGGKTAQLLAAGANVTALDISESRLKKLETNMKRLGFEEKIEIINTDALKFLQDNQKQYDVILLDAPCSATGILRRHPEVIHLKNQKDIENQALLQQKLLTLTANSLKKGGMLLYCVCSLSRLEGEWMIKKFLAEDSHYKIIPVSADCISKYGKWNSNLISQNGTIRTLPFYEKELGGMDGFFICLMQRIN